MIDSKDISVVVQGAIDLTETPKCLNSIRKQLPEAKIILSTWEGSNVEGLDYDILLLNKDPGAFYVISSGGGKIYNNLNRQLHSTKEGLKRVDTKYALKVRSDIILDSNSFLNYYDKFPKRCDEYKLFKNRIIIHSVSTRFGIIPFHFSDWWFFGLTEDLKTYFMDTPFVNEPEYTTYFVDKKSPYGELKHRFASEQYFAYQCFSRNFADIRMRDGWDYNKETIKKSQLVFINNFIALDYAQSGIWFNKHMISKYENTIGSMYTDLWHHYKWLENYKKYCDKDYKLKPSLFMMDDDKLLKAINKIKYNCDILSNKKNKITKRFLALIFRLPYSLILFLVKFIIQIIRFFIKIIFL